jgi:apolipoprotein N-acyltransferase
MSSKIVSTFILLALGSILAVVAELPYGGWIQIPVLSLIWWRLNPQTPNSLKNQFLLGLVFGVGYFVVGLWWLYISLHDVGGMNTGLACMGVFLLSAYVALYFSLATLAIPLFKNNRLAGLFLASSWVLAEFLRGYIFTGFPWMGFAETQVSGPFFPLAPYLGGLGCTFFTVFASWQILKLKKYFSSSALSLVAISIITIFASQWSFTKPIGTPLQVELIQGNFSQSLIFKPEGILQQIAFYHDAITQSKAELIIAPETAFPWPENQLPSGLMPSLINSSNSNNSNLLFGLIGRESIPQNNREFSNRALGISPLSPPYVYDKNHLVPFGEFIPPGFHWFVNAFSVPLSDFARGGIDQPNFKILRNNQDPIYAAITICYEDVFGGELAGRLRDSTLPTNLLINLTNLAWFGDSQAPTQQLRLSQLRSKETGLPALRATNTGITAVLGPDGKVLSALPGFTQTTLSTQVQAYSGKTPYVIWGNLPILGISCLLLLWGVIRYRRF